MPIKSKRTVKNETPRFYEMDGALRAYSNRSIVIAGVMGLAALSLSSAFYSCAWNRRL